MTGAYREQSLQCELLRGEKGEGGGGWFRGIETRDLTGDKKKKGKDVLPGGLSGRGDILTRDDAGKGLYIERGGRKEGKGGL